MTEDSSFFDFSDEFENSNNKTSEESKNYFRILNWTNALDVQTIIVF